MSPMALAEIVAAARAVVDSFEEEIPGLGAMPTQFIDRLRKALSVADSISPPSLTRPLLASSQN